MDTEDPTYDSGYEAPFAALLGMLPGLSADGVGSATMSIREDHRQGQGVVQGGIIVTLADYASFRAVKSKLGQGQVSVTVELKVNFTAPARDGKLTATAKIISGGRRIIVVEVEVTDERHTMIAKGMGTFMVTQERS